jgi:hypothetical protein
MKNNLNYQNILNTYFKSNNSHSIPKYIPVKNMNDFNYDVITYYNQYCASEKTTQNRRILRNYLSNQQTIKQYNKNPFINNKGIKYYFLYAEIQTYMIVENLNEKNANIYILIGKCWCHHKYISSLNDCKEWISTIKNLKQINN